MRGFLILIIALMILLPAVTTLAVRKQIGIQQEKEDRLVYFYGNKVYEYTFVSPDFHLNSVSIKMKNQQIRNHNPILFTLFSLPEKREIQLNGVNISDGDWVRFSFPEIANSKDQAMDIKIESPTSSDQDAIGVMVDQNNQPAIITYHKIESYPRLIFSIYQNWLKHLTQDILFLILWAGAISILLDKLYFHRRGDKTV